MPEPAFTKLVNQPASTPVAAAAAVVPMTYESTAPSPNSNSDNEQNPTSAAATLPQQGRNNNKKTYRGGFSTSICGLFSDPSRRTDCCALACCGVLSADRNRYLLNNEQPPPWWRRIVVNICLPLFLHLADRAVVDYVERETVLRECHYVFPSKSEQSQQSNKYNSGYSSSSVASAPDLSDLEPLQTLHHVLKWLFIGVVVFLLVRAASKRKQFRTKFIDRLYLERYRGSSQEPGSTCSGQGVVANRMTNRSDTSVATRTCGCCYAAPDLDYVGLRRNDAVASSEMDRDDDNGGSVEADDLCSCLWNFVASLCCGACCGAWCQCCGMCATGQEEREVNRIVPEEARMIDYVSFEPYENYFPSIENLRRVKDGKFSAHFKSLSRLSVNLVKGLGITLAFLLLLALTDVDSHFTFENMIVVLATLFQAFLVLYFVHWKWHRLDVSLDLAVKCFASGFIFSTSTAIVVEILVSWVVTACMAVLGFFALIFEAGFLADNASDDPKEITKALIKENAWLGILFMFLNAFVVAALIEELCKYFGFWMVEHPDLQEKEETSEEAKEDGQLDTTFSICDEDEESESDIDPNDEHIGTNEEPSSMQMQQSLNSTGTGITIAMVTAAMGFACCENLEYVFSSQDVKTELGILLLRSLVPVHALAAAIQSIGVCQRDLEGDKSFKLGRIILPAVLLHGAFDFFLMVAPVLLVENHVDELIDGDGLSEKDKEYNQVLATCMKYDAVDENIWKPKGPYEGNPEEALSPTDIAILATTYGLALLSLIVGIVYYVLESRKQKVRLKALEAARRQNASEGSTCGLV